MSSDRNHQIVIDAKGISKIFHIYSEPYERLLQSFYRSKKQFFREVIALENISFDVKRGETVGIIGANGAGKSTLLQILCGTLAPSAGSVKVSGRVAALLELGAGFNAEFTGRENIILSASIYGLSQSEIESKMESIIAFADIGSFIDEPIKTYSSGMYVRLGFAVIAHVNADILIIDEALAVGDAFFTQKCMRFLRKFRESGTLFFVSHDMGSILNFCQKAIWIDGGKLSMEGTAKDVSQAYLKHTYARETNEPLELNTTENTTIEVDQNLEYWDQRKKFLNTSNLRNDLEVFTFDFESESFGLGGATITDVYLVDSAERPLNWIVGGEYVELVVQIIANQPLRSPIVGFMAKDSLGQNLFGDNTFLEYHETPLSIEANSKFVARFGFSMPILPSGDYVIQVAIATGSQEEHQQQHWIHEALAFKSHNTSVKQGLAGLQLHKLSIEVVSK